MLFLLSASQPLCALVAWGWCQLQVNMRLRLLALDGFICAHFYCTMFTFPFLVMRCMQTR